MSVYFPQVVIPTLPPQTTLDVTLTVQGDPPTGSLAYLRDASWRLQAVFTADSRIQNFLDGTLQGEYFLIGQKYTEPKAASARLVSLTGEDQSFYVDIDEGQRPRPGHGYLAGDHPEGITRVEGEPSPATIRVHYRAESGTPGDGVLVAEVQSNEDGTWLVQNLDPDLKFDVICRYPGYNDMILSNVSPVLAAGLQFEGSFSTLDDQVEILLGTGPYQVDVVDGALPPGVEIQVAGDVMSLVGTPEEWGQFSFVVRVIDSAGISGVFASELDAIQPLPSALGEPWGGGFYAGDIESDGQWYKLIIADVADDVDGIPWRSGSGSAPGADHPTDGAANTAAMLALGEGVFLAAEYCANYQGGGFSDWYLPAPRELDEIYSNLGFNQPDCPPNFASGGAQTFNSSRYYWSSSPSATGAYYVYSVRFSDGRSSNISANGSTVRTRPVRRIAYTPSEN